MATPLVRAEAIRQPAWNSEDNEPIPVQQLFDRVNLRTTQAQFDKIAEEVGKKNNLDTKNWWANPSMVDDLGRSSLRLAITKCSAALVDHILANGGACLLEQLDNVYRDEGETPLEAAVNRDTHRDRYKIVKLLLSYGARIDQSRYDRDGLQTLHSAKQEVEERKAVCDAAHNTAGLPRNVAEIVADYRG